ncbi:DNA primase [Mycoplasmatota bacterium]|nr:DNA primase [Mycoplasmatota bacterium]
MFIPNHIVDQVIKGNDILQVVSSYVKLEKKGKNYFGLCPFHSEKTPSFSVSPEKQIFHCFSCGEGGNVAQFISKIDNLSYLDSIKKLASQINLNIDNYFDDNKSIEQSKYFSMNQFVSDYYQFALLNTKEGKIALKYLYQRNINDDLIKQFKIGLAPDSTDSLYQALKSNHFPELSMLELGHVIKSNNHFYDKFKNRIMFPICDEYGNIVGFSGRSYLDTNKNEPKYMNTQETPIFKKSNIIYNLYHAKKTIKQNKRVFLFEGFMDVIASYRSGLFESVATMGTALTDDHINQLKKLTKHVIICYDGDKAGIEASKRAITSLNKHYVKTSVVNLPEGLDPDEYFNQYGKTQYLDYLNRHQKSYKEYMYEIFHTDINLNDISSIEGFKKKIFQLILNATPTEQELYLSKLSNDIQVSLKTLQFDYSQYTKYLKKSNEPSHYDVVAQERIIKTIEKNRPSSRKLLGAQETIIFYSLYNRKFVNIINVDSKISFDDRQYRRLFYDISDFYNIYDCFDYEDFLAKYVKEDKTYGNFYKKVYDKFLKYKGSYEEIHLEQCFAVIVNELIAKVVEQLKEKLKRTNTEEEQKQIYQEIIENYKIIKVKN